MNKKIKHIIKTMTALFFVVLVSIINSYNVNAISEDELYKKALLNVMQKCYNNEQISSSLDSAVWSGFSGSILKKGKKQSNLFIPTSIGSGNALDQQKTGTKIGCYELFLGDAKGEGTYGGTMDGLFSLYSIKTTPKIKGKPINEAEKAAKDNNLPGFLTGLGYTPGNPAKKSCFNLRYSYYYDDPDDVLYPVCMENKKVSGIKNYKLGSVCWAKSYFGKSDSKTIASAATVENEKGNSFVNIVSPLHGYNNGISVYFGTSFDRDGINNEFPITSKSSKFELKEMQDGFKSILKAYNYGEDHANFVIQSGENDQNMTCFDISEESYSEEDMSAFNSYNIANMDTSYNQALAFISGGGTHEQFSNLEKYSIYSLYLSKVYNAVIDSDCQDTKPDSATTGSGDDKTYRIRTSKGWCKVATLDSGKTVSGFKDGNDWYMNTYFDFEGLIGAMYNIADSLTEEDLVQVESIASVESNQNEQTPEDPPDCYDAGIEGMSWVLCPVANNTGHTVSGLESLLRDLLSIDTQQVFKDGTETAWSVFRNIANVILIIVFLAIIFSQLTGYGIDNYGIKKMLPKLIVMAILINLSYVICQLAVDLSNILGVGLDNLFANIGERIKPGAGGFTVSKIFVALMGLLGTAGTIAGIAVGSGGGTTLIVTLVLALLVALVAVLMFFVSLAARTIIVIIFVVIAPVAFALYILPNTKDLFKKWWKIFEAALVIYPICGALYGASFIIKALVVNPTPNGGVEVGFVDGIIAIVAPFLPFLLLPSLLKGALAGLGALGGTLTTLGNGLKKGLEKGSGAVKSTDRFKDAQERNRERRIQSRAGIGRDGKEKQLSRFGKFMRGGERGIARSRMQYIKNQEARAREKDMMGEGFGAMLAGSEAKIDAQRVADQEALIVNGKIAGVNVNNANSVARYHADAIKAYRGAKTDQARAEAMTRIKAAQNILSKTEAGRNLVQNNIESAASNGDVSGLQEAASQILSQSGDTYKSKNRGTHSMLMDLASATPTEQIVDKIKNGTYNVAGTDKYTAESLAGADDQALTRFEQAISSGKLTGNELSNIQATAYEALEKQRGGTLNIKPEVKTHLEKICRGYVPPLNIQHNKPSGETFTDGAGI